MEIRQVNPLAEELANIVNEVIDLSKNDRHYLRDNFILRLQRYVLSQGVGAI
jgi:hypothetical protein